MTECEADRAKMDARKKPDMYKTKINANVARQERKEAKRVTNAQENARVSRYLAGFTRTPAPCLEPTVRFRG